MYRTKPVGLFALVALTGLVQSSIHISPKVEFTSNQTELFAQWRTLETRLGDLTAGAVKLLLNSMTQSEIEIGPDCEIALTELVFALSSSKLWAFKLVDAIAKPQAGILTGSLTSMGSYDECVAVDGGSPGLQGKYCHLDVRTALPPKRPFYRFDEEVEELENFTTKSELLRAFKKDVVNFYFVAFRFGICIPSACSQQDINKIAKSILSGIGVNGQVTSCEVRKQLEFADDQLGICVVLCSFAILVLLASLLHSILSTHKKDRKGRFWQILEGFSISRNLKSTFSTKSEAEGDHLAFLHGLKFISMSWVMLGHIYLFLNWQLFNNLHNAKKFSQDFFFQAVINASVSVDTFFFITAVLVSVLTLGAVEKYGSRAFNPPLLFVHRYWRTVPPAMVAVGLMVLVPLIGSGPVWHETLDIIVENCRTNWWQLFVMGNNFVYPRDTCLQHTWYISCDLQFFICALIYFWLHFKSETYSRIFAVAVIVLGVIATGVTTYILEFPPTMLLPNIDPVGRWEIWRYHYFLPIAHTGPYMLGLLLGTWLSRKEKLNMNKLTEICGWVVAFAINLAVLYSPYMWSLPVRATLLEAVAYSALHRLGWGLGLTWLGLCCSQGRGGPIRAILAWSGWKPLSRLTFSIYILHFMVFWTFMAAFRSPLDARHAVAIWVWLGHLIVCGSLALLFRTIFELPLLTLERVALGSVVKKVKKEDVHSKQNGQNGESIKL